MRVLKVLKSNAWMTMARALVPVDYPKFSLAHAAAYHVRARSCLKSMWRFRTMLRSLSHYLRRKKTATCSWSSWLMKWLSSRNSSTKGALKTRNSEIKWCATLSRSACHKRFQKKTAKKARARLTRICLSMLHQRIKTQRLHPRRVKHRSRLTWPKCSRPLSRVKT